MFYDLHSSVKDLKSVIALSSKGGPFTGLEGGTAPFPPSLYVLGLYFKNYPKVRTKQEMHISLGQKEPAKKFKFPLHFFLHISNLMDNY